MSPDDKNSATNATFDAILRRTMRQSPADATSDCPEPGLLAAYYDRSIDASERKHLDEHFADCARCQMQLASIARADSEVVASEKRSPLAWLRGWRIAIPALATAAALLIAIKLTHRTESQFEPAAMVAMSKPEAPAAPVTESLASLQSPPAATAPAAPAKAPVAPGVVGDLALNDMMRAPALGARKAELADRVEPLAKEKSRDTLERAAKPDAERFAFDSARQGQKIQNSSPMIAPRAKAEAPREPSTASSGALAMRADAAADKGSSSATASINSFGGGAGGASSMSAAGASPRGAAGASSMSAAGASSMGGPGAPRKGPPYTPPAGSPALPGYNVAVSVDGSAWRVGANGKIERSVVGGDFVAQNSGVTVELLAAAAVSKDACWVGGGGGTILRTIDGGASWRRVTSPTGGDISGISASSADDAVVTTIDGKSFATSDGGATWRPQ